jgi:hypothetical protein
MNGGGCGDMGGGNEIRSRLFTKQKGHDIHDGCGRPHC